MAITYTWAVTGLKTTTEGQYSEVVVQTYWTKTGTDENSNTGTFSGATPFTASSVAPGTFVPFNELTQDIVLGWIQPVVVGSYADHVDSQIAKQIAAKIDPVVEQPLPWAPAPIPPTPPTP